MNGRSYFNKKDSSSHWLLNLIGSLFFAGLAPRLVELFGYYPYRLKGGYLSLPKPIMLFYDLTGEWA
jgi:hypothetical protein